jgi:Aerotolerance regulator N-terminal/von Willebrand factor type A domain/CARDB
MTFLNPFVLFGLAAATIPIILHLLNLRKLRTVEFSTLTFLKELQKSTIRRVKIRQWLLLFLRTLLIALLVFAFSRPALKGSFAGIGTHAKTTIVLILDNTYSMSLGNEHGKYFKQAKDVAHGLTDLLKRGDDAFLIRLSDVPEPTTPAPTHDAQTLKALIDQSQLSYKRRTIEDAIPLAFRLLRQSNNLNKEIYVVTDGQRSTVMSAHQTEQSIQAADSRVKLFVVPLAEKPFDNIAVQNVSIPPSLLQVNKPFEVQAAIRNFGTSPVQNVIASVSLDGARVMQKNISISPGEATSADFVVLPQHTGFTSGFVEVDGDEYEADNKFYFSFYIPSHVNVLLVSPTPSAETYLRLALTAGNSEDTTGNSTSGSTSSYISLRETLPSRLTTARLEDADVIILSHAPSLQPIEADMLSEFLATKGGGIIFFPGNGIQVDQYNDILFPKIGLPPLQPVVSIGQNAGAFVTFDKVDYQHPIFQGMFESSPGAGAIARHVESPQITTFVGFAPQSEGQLRSIISLSNGLSFLWEKSSGDGRVLGFAVPPDKTWSDFPMKGIFVPLVYQTVLYAASGGKISSADAIVGEKFDIPLSALYQSVNAVAPIVRILNPEKNEQLVQSSWTTGAGTSKAFAPLDETSMPGIYLALQNKDTLAEIPVNVDEGESDETLASEKDFLNMFKHFGISEDAVTFVHAPENLGSVVLQSRFGIELWKYFLIAALCIGIIEMLVAREPKESNQ